MDGMDGMDARHVRVCMCACVIKQSSVLTSTAIREGKKGVFRDSGLGPFIVGISGILLTDFGRDFGIGY